MDMGAQIASMWNTLTPWTWVVLALLLGMFEMASFSFFLIWPALAALITAILLGFFPAMSVATQLVYFASLSIILTIAGRFSLSKLGNGGESGDAALNQRGTRLQGEVATVLEFSCGKGAVEVHGIRWRAEWAKDQTAKSGDRVVVSGVNGMTLTIEAKDENAD